MEYPLIIEGVEKGSVSFQPCGLYTVAEASLDADPGRLVRLWAHGGGESAYLGLMQPWSEGLYLRRRLSRRDLEAFPKPIERISDEEAPAESGAEESVPQAKAGSENERESLHNNKTCPWPAPVTEETEGLLWMRRADGTLTAHDGVSTLVAFPAALRSAPERAALRRIEGRDYLVFRT